MLFCFNLLRLYVCIFSTNGSSCCCCCCFISNWKPTNWRSIWSFHSLFLIENNLHFEIHPIFIRPRMKAATLPFSFKLHAVHRLAKTYFMYSIPYTKQLYHSTGRDWSKQATSNHLHCQRLRNLLQFFSFDFNTLCNFVTFRKLLINDIPGDFGCE